MLELMSSPSLQSAPSSRPPQGSKPECPICAIFLIRRSYGKRWWFRLLREPLVWGMRLIAWMDGLNDWKQKGRNADCKGCVRYLKNELEEKSPLFRFLNKFIGPYFKDLRDSALGQEEFGEAKRLAREAMEAEVKKPEA